MFVRHSAISVTLYKKDPLHMHKYWSSAHKYKCHPHDIFAYLKCNFKMCLSEHIPPTRNAVTPPHHVHRELQFISINIIGRLIRKLRSSITYPKHIESTRVSDSAISYLHMERLYSLDFSQCSIYASIHATLSIGCNDGFKTQRRYEHTIGILSRL